MRTSARTRRAAVALAFSMVLLGIGIGSSMAHAGRQVRVLRYEEVNGNGPTLIVRGRGCLQAEDSLRLRKTAYVGGSDPLVEYRCIIP